MKLAMPTVTDTTGMPYHFRDAIGINYRNFAMWLIETRQPDESQTLLTINFPWTAESQQQNRKAHHYTLPQSCKALALHYQQELTANSGVIVYAEVSKLFCMLVIASTQPEEAKAQLQSLPCPDEFGLPEITVLTTSTQAFLQQKLS
ncbi:hypothetical protein OCL06_04785 [Alteromonas sp. ASW11-19]|uniref:Uncharacterized protein n=1 Tax=Alteromonas salexigens TaxID=2982530 RepID=A0ABT2VKX5_9ALTE|nr:hypothetical protein [Alteromonas salexigens]MCU7553909.1 hypothetical protein [Alteromonas salexigens]